MKVVHICTSLDGGAGLCALRIVKATREIGVDSKVLVARGEMSENVDVIPPPTYHWAKNWLTRKIQVLSFLTGLRPKTERILKRIEKVRNNYHVLPSFTSPATQYTNLADHPWIKEADVIHLHWVGNFLDYMSFFSKVNKPIIWTAHDQNPGLGGFHNTSMKEAEQEPVKKLDDELMKIKAKAYRKTRNLTMIAISSEMCKFFHDSWLLKRFPVVKIHNGIETDKFKLLNKQECRDELSINQQKKVFLFVAYSIHSKIKGLDRLITALEALHRNDIMLICIGLYDHTPKASFEIRCTGFITDSYHQSRYYSAADFFVLPSFQETFAQSPMEAMACGTPVVSYPCSGATDLINNNNGIVCENFSIDALAMGIKLALNRKYDRDEIRKDVINRFSYDRIARQYLSLYESLLNN